MPTIARSRLLLAAAILTVTGLIVAHTTAQDRRRVITPGRLPNGDVLVTTNQRVSPLGHMQETTGVRPKDIALSPDGKLVAVLTNKANRAILLYASDTGDLKDSADNLKYTPDALGLAWAPDGRSLYAACQRGVILRFTVDPATSKMKLAGDLHVGGRTDPQVLGLAVSPDQTRLYAALGIRNEVAVFSLPSGELLRTAPVGVAPYRLLLSHDGDTLYVANRGGKRANSDGAPTARSAGTKVRIDPATDAPQRGSLSIIDVTSEDMDTEEVPVGKQPGGMALTADDGTLYVANSDSDSIVRIDTKTQEIVQRIGLTPPGDFGFGRMPTSLALSDDGKTLFAACGGENAVAVIHPSAFPRVAGYLPAAWFPIAVAQHGGRLIVASTKGIGPRILNPRTKSYYVHNSIGAMQFIADTDWPDINAQTQRVARNNHWSWERFARPDQPARPVPERVGEPSVFKHVVYIIKENQTYDSLLGDMPEGNGDKSLNLYGESVCPNHHRIARDFVLLDNTYTSGTNSADGHQWCDEAVANAYIEQNYDAHVRSYPYDGGDPLAYSPNGFLWNFALRRHLSVRVYGEFVNRPHIKCSSPHTLGTWTNLWNDRTQKAGKFEITASTDNAALAPCLHPHYIGFPLVVSDQWRADQFLTDLGGFEKAGAMPNLCILELPCDHTSGLSPGMPAPASCIADNDLALGRIVDGISHSPFWKDTLIFVIEDDSQAAVDHVDGHRTAAFCISPYTRRHTVVSQYYNHTSVLRTIELVLGLPAMTRFDRTAVPMGACFMPIPDFTPYTVLLNRTPLDTLNKPTTSLTGRAHQLAFQSAGQDWSIPDRADAAVVAKSDWYSRKPNTPFPASLFCASQPDGDDK